MKIIRHFDIKHNKEVTPAEYLAALRILHVACQKEAKSTGVIPQHIRDRQPTSLKHK